MKRGSRLVNLSSAGHRFSDVDLEDPNFERTRYTEFGAYGRSKTANILFAVEFDRRHKGDGVRATAVHPGGIQTELGRHMTPEGVCVTFRARFFLGWLFRHNLEDDEDNEVGVRARDYRAMRRVPWEPLGRIRGG